MIILVILFVAAVVVAILYWPEIRDELRVGTECRDGIPRDSYCVACQERRDRRHDH